MSDTKRSQCIREVNELLGIQSSSPHLPCDDELSEHEEVPGTSSLQTRGRKELEDEQKKLKYKQAKKIQTSLSLSSLSMILLLKLLFVVGVSPLMLVFNYHLSRV